MKSGTLTRRNAEILLAAVILARSTSFVLSKIGLQGMGKFTLLGLRFLIAFVFLALLFPRHLQHMNRRTFLGGLGLGVMFFLVMTAELSALETVASSTASFLENTAIVLVPLLEAALCRKLPTRQALCSAAVSLAGVGLLTSGGGFTVAPGELYCVAAAVVYAAAILFADRLTHSGANPLGAGIVQVGCIGLLSMAAAFVFETPQLPSSGGTWAVVLTLALVCSGFGFALQPVAQSGTTAERAGMFCALSPLCAAVLGAAVLGEKFGLQSLFGAALIVGGIVISHLQTPAPGLRLRRQPAAGDAAGKQLCSK